MNELQIFNYESNEVRTVMRNGEPWFCLADVCKVLDLSSPHKVAERLDRDELTGIKVRSGGQTREMTFINESGLYSVILRSDKPKAKPSRARLASVWLKIANTNPVPEYKQICTHYASAVLAGREVLPLPEAAERTYSAEEVGELLGGVSANMVGRMANQNGLKTPEYGIQVWDKSRHSAKQVPSWRYNDRAVDRLREILKA